MQNLQRIFFVSIILLFSTSASSDQDDNSKESNELVVTQKMLREILKKNWSSMDKEVGLSENISGFTHKLQWYEKFSPPFPKFWPPQKSQIYAYYVYAEYDQFLIHGSLLSWSAPWAKIYFSKDSDPHKEIISSSIGPTVSGNSSRPLGNLQAKRLSEIYEYETSIIPKFLNWVRTPDNEEDVKAVREFYCQWELDHKFFTSEYISKNHESFFEWLSCGNLKVINGIVMP